MAMTPVAPKGLEALLPRTPTKDRTTEEEPIVLQISHTSSDQLA
jgi:hypothetical protein